MIVIDAMDIVALAMFGIGLVGLVVIYAIGWILHITEKKKKERQREDENQT